MNKMATVLECRICGNTQGNMPYEVSETMFGTGERFNYYKCSACGCLQIGAVPENMDRFYPPGYYSFKSSSVSERAKKLQSRYQFYGRGLAGRIISTVFPGGKGAVYNFLSHALSKGDITFDSGILDVGSGDGSLLSSLAHIGFKNLTGVDPYIGESCERANGVKLVKSTIRKMEGTYDLIMFNHSLEHIFEQRESLEAARARLSPVGTCLVRIPLVSCYAWQKYGVHWCHIEAPRHFFLHSAHSMEILCDKSGFYIENAVWDSSESQFIGSERHMKGLGMLQFPRNITYRLLHYGRVMEYRRQAALLNSQKQGDQAAFFLRKK